MKAFSQLSRITSMIILVAAVTGAQAQEYDDLYFTSNDRKIAEAEAKNIPSVNTYESYSNDAYSDDYTLHNVNPEYIARYQTNKEYASDSEYAGEDNENYSTPSYSNISYYPEEQVITQIETGAEPQTVIVNFNSPYAWNSVFTDPWVGWQSGIGWNDPFFYDPWLVGGSSWGWNFGFGMNNCWGASFGRNQGFGRGGSFGFRQGWGNPMFVSGFYDPRFGYFGGNPWNINGYAYQQRFMSNLDAGSRADLREARRWSSGERSSRGGTVVTNSRTSASRTITPVSGSRASASNADSRDFSNTQNEYYSRSRTGASSSSSRSSGNVVSSRSSSASASSGRVSSTSNNSRTRYATSTPSSGSNGRVNSSSSGTNSRRYTTTPSSSSRSNSSYSSGSNNSSRNRSSSYSSGSSGRSSSSYSSGRSSSSSSGRSSSSYSSGSSSRSSSGSSRSSSGSSRSSSSSSRSSRGGGK